MAQIVFRGPEGEVVLDPGREFLRGLIETPPEGYWARGSGDGELERSGDGPSRTLLLILPHEGLGFYLKYLETTGKQIVCTWLSLHDRDKLREVTTCSDEWLASVGLFLPAALAADAVEEFAVTGQRSARVQWIQPDAIPEDGNW